MADPIDRQAALSAADSIIERDMSGNNDVVKAMTAWKKFIDALPPTQPGCEDAVSRAEVLDEISNAFGLVDAGQRVFMLPSVTPKQPGWIPCDKGEPDEDMECWVTVKTTDALYRGNFTKRYGERRDKGFITSGGFMWWNTALAWMPIYEPEPYRPEGEEHGET